MVATSQYTLTHAAMIEMPGSKLAEFHSALRERDGRKLAWAMGISDKTVIDWAAHGDEIVFTLKDVECLLTSDQHKALQALGVEVIDHKFMVALYWDNCEFMVYWEYGDTSLRTDSENGPQMKIPVDTLVSCAKILGVTTFRM